MGKLADDAAIALVQAISKRADNPLPRMQTRILGFLVERGYVGGRGILHAELALIATHFGRSFSLVRHEIGKLVKIGAVLRWQDEWQIVHYAFNPDWDGVPDPEEEVAA